MFLTYEEYKEIGGTLDIAAFNSKIVRAEAMINNHTKHRLYEFEVLPEEVKYLCRDLVEYISHNVVDKAISSKSQSAGGVSESVNYIVKSVDDYYNDITMLMADYLGGVKTERGVPVLYKGAAN